MNPIEKFLNAMHIPVAPPPPDYIAIAFDQTKQTAFYVCRDPNQFTANYKAVAATHPGTPIHIIDAFQKPSQNWCDIAYWLAEFDLFGCDNLRVQQELTISIAKELKREIQETIAKGLKG